MTRDGRGRARRFQSNMTPIGRVCELREPCSQVETYVVAICSDGLLSNR
jgi:hypothetical protein